MYSSWFGSLHAPYISNLQYYRASSVFLASPQNVYEQLLVLGVSYCYRKSSNFNSIIINVKKVAPSLEKKEVNREKQEQKVLNPLSGDYQKNTRIFLSGNVRKETTREVKPEKGTNRNNGKHPSRRTKTGDVKAYFPSIKYKGHVTAIIPPPFALLNSCRRECLFRNESRRRRLLARINTKCPAISRTYILVQKDTATTRMPCNSPNYTYIYRLQKSIQLLNILHVCPIKIILYSNWDAKIQNHV